MVVIATSIVESSCSLEGQLFLKQGRTNETNFVTSANNDEISPNFLLGKFWGNGHISHNLENGNFHFP